MFINIWEAAWIGAKWGGLLLIALILVILYRSVFKVWLMRNKYLKYPNCGQTKWFYPLLGDFAIILSNVRKNKSIVSHYIDNAIETRGVDVRLVFNGDIPQFQLISLKAHKEFLELFPQQVDRSDALKKFATKMWTNSIEQLLTKDRFKLIRSEFLKSIGFNEISERILEMIKIFDSFTDSWTEGENLNLIDDVQDLTFKVMSYLLFGNDATSIMNHLLYIESDGSKSAYGFGKFYRKLLEDLTLHYLSIRYKLFPNLADNNLIEPFKTDRKNIDYMDSRLYEFIKQTKDNESALNKMIRDDKLTLEEFINNLKLFLIAGTESSSRCISSIIYLLFKHKSCYWNIENILNNLKEKRSCTL